MTRVTAAHAGAGDVRLCVFVPENDAIAVVLTPRQTLALVAALIVIIAGMPERALEPAEPVLWGAERGSGVNEIAGRGADTSRPAIPSRAGSLGNHGAG